MKCRGNMGEERWRGRRADGGRKEGNNEGRKEPSPSNHPSIAAAAAALLRIRPWNVQVGEKEQGGTPKGGGQTAVLAPRRKGKETVAAVVVTGWRRLYSRPEAQSSQGDRDILLFTGMRVRDFIVPDDGMKSNPERENFVMWPILPVDQSI